MSHTYVSLLTHIVFSTKDRTPSIDAVLEARLLPYLGGIVRELKGKLLTVNGAADHLHLLASIPATVCVADVVKSVKGSSSLWIHETFPEGARFAWQRGYSAFSVSVSNADRVSAYIARQKLHHQKIDFRTELLELLRRHGISPDERFLWT